MKLIILSLFLVSCNIKLNLNKGECVARKNYTGYSLKIVEVQKYGVLLVDRDNTVYYRTFDTLKNRYKLVDCSSLHIYDNEF